MKCTVSQMTLTRLGRPSTSPGHASRAAMSACVLSRSRAIRERPSLTMLRSRRLPTRAQHPPHARLQHLRCYNDRRRDRRAGHHDTGNHCFDCSTALTLPFPVTLYGLTYTLAQVGADGYMSFGATYNYDPTCLPAIAMTYAIVPFWAETKHRCTR